MRRSFQDYVAYKQDVNILNGFDNLCEDIVLAGLTFEAYWENYGLRHLVEGVYADEEDLLMELSFNPMNLFRRNQPAPQPNPWDRGMQNLQQQRQDRLTQMQPQVEKAVAAVREKFMQAMQSFLNTVSADAAKNKNRMEYYVAQHLYQRLTKAMQSYNPKPVYGTSPHSDSYNQAVQQHTASATPAAAPATPPAPAPAAAPTGDESGKAAA